MLSRHGMKRALTLALIGVVSTACSVFSGGDEEALVSTQPYQSHCTKHNKSGSPYFVYGVGVGADIASARNAALADIAGSLSSQISVQTTSTLSSVNDVESDSFKQNVDISSHVSIDDAVETCRDTGDPGGSVHLVFRLDKRPVVQKVYSDLITSWGGIHPNLVLMKGPSILIGSKFVAELKAKLERGNAGIDVQTVVLDLQRKNNTWVLSVGQNATYTIADRSFLTFIAPNFIREVKALDLSVLHADQMGSTELATEDFQFARSARLRHGDSFVFRASSRRNGYLSIFNVYEDGRIANLLENRSIAAGKSIQFPEGGTFTSLLLEDGKTTYDVYIAVLTEAPVLISQFGKLNDDGFLTGKNSYQFDQFLRWYDFISPLGVATLEARTDP